MRLTAATFTLVVTVSALAGASNADACSCVGSPLIRSIESADVLFLGHVTAVERQLPAARSNADGSVTVFGGALPAIATFEVLRVFRGSANGAVSITGGGTNCDVSFHIGETWLVYGGVATQGVQTGKCSRTRLLPQARPDIEYLEGTEAGRPQGVVFGELLRRGLWQGRRQLMSPEPSTPLIVVAVSGGRRIEMAGNWSSYDLILPPGSAQIWVELAGRPVMTPISVDVTDRGEHRLLLIVEYPN